MKKSVFREKYNQPLELDVVIYHTYIAKIGGIETWIYYIAKKYNIGQITVLYSQADDEQLARLRPYVNLIQYTGQSIKCNKIIFTMTISVVPDLYREAKERYAIIHCNYNDKFKYEYAEIPRMDKIYAVSDVAKESFKKVQEQEVFTLYNPVAPDKPRRLLKLISATRLTEEKGLSRMQKLSQELEQKGIPYIWLIFTDNPPEKVSKNIILMKPRYNMSDYMVQADYGVQLSDDESYCLFIQECLKLKVPVIVTDLPVYKEVGITEKEAYIIDLDMSNLDVDKIYKNIPKVNYRCKNSSKDYKKLLEGKSDK